MHPAREFAVSHQPNVVYIYQWPSASELEAKCRSIAVDVLVISDGTPARYISSIWPSLIDTTSAIAIYIGDSRAQPDIDTGFLNAHGPWPCLSPAPATPAAAWVVARTEGANCKGGAGVWVPVVWPWGPWPCVISDMGGGVVGWSYLGGLGGWSGLGGSCTDID